MKRKKILFLLFIFISHIPVLAQVDTAWVRRYNGSGNGYDEARAVAVDDSGHVYVTGSSAGPGTGLDFSTIKYTPDGDTLWVRRYNGPENISDEPLALVVDDTGNVYVTGYSWGAGTREDYATIKYAPNGDTLWVRRYNGPGNNLDKASALVRDDSGNVYVTGYSVGSGTGIDFATIKYAPNGDTLWLRRYNGPGNSSDQGLALAVDDSMNVYVTGHSTVVGPSTDYATIKYSSNGDTLWVRRYNGPGNDVDIARALLVDSSHNIYVTGQSRDAGTGHDYATIKYDPNGGTLWVRRYNGPGNDDDVALALVVDDSDNIYVTGFGTGAGTGYDYATIKYSPDGDTLWVRDYNGPGNGDDVALALELDSGGNAYITGHSAGAGTGSDLATLKYAPNGDTLWVRRYNGSANSLDGANALVVDDSGNVYVTGWSIGSGTSYDYATIKYSPCSAQPGDVNGDGSYSLPDIIGEVNIVFKGAPIPTPTCRTDANADNGTSLPDIIILVNKVFKGGPTPPPIGVCCL